MPTYKNITVKKRGGGTRKQRVMVLASGKYRFVKNKGKSKSSSKKKTKTKGKKKYMAKKKRKSSRRKFTLPLGIVAPVAASFVSNMGVSGINSQGIFGDIKAGRIDWAARDLALLWTGYDSASGKLDFMKAKALQALFGGYIVHKAASMLGINRALGRARVPIIRI